MKHHHHGRPFTAAPRLRITGEAEKRDTDELRELTGLPRLPAPAMRKCLGCGLMFESAGPGNRMCRKCLSADYAEQAAMRKRGRSRAREKPA